MLDAKKILKYRSNWMAVAIIMVILYHRTIVPEGTWLADIHDVLYGGVDIFVFASGIGCYYSYNNIKMPYVFIKRRMKKLLPTYLLALVPYVAVSVPNMTVKEIIANVLSYSYLGNLSYYFSWYVALIWILYILTPYIYYFLTTGEKKEKWWRYTTVITIAILISISFIDEGGAILATSRFPIYAIGMCAADYCINNDRINLRIIITLLSMMVLGFVVLFRFIHVYREYCWDFGLYWHPYIIITPGLCLCISCLCMQLSRVPLFEKIIGLIGKWIGGNTFALYMADNCGEPLAALMGYEWDSMQMLIMTRRLLLPVTVILIIFDLFCQSIIKRCTNEHE